jgi:uncharacterized delta-60 repeat protein
MKPGISNAGTLDPSFGDDGKFYPALPSDSHGIIRAVTMGPDNKIYYGGSFLHSEYEHKYFLGRLNPDGTADTTFGSNPEGVVIDNFDGRGLVQCDAITVTNDKQHPKVFWVGQLSLSEKNALARYNADGTPDKIFGAGNTGKVVLDLELGQTASSESDTQYLPRTSSGSSSGTAQTLPGGKLLIYKYHLVNIGGPAWGYIIRLNLDGSLDTRLNESGYFTVSHPDYREKLTQLTSIMVQDDGKYLGCGAVWEGGSSAHIPMFVRYDTDGKPDDSFGTKGFALVRNSEGRALRLSSMAKQKNDRILGIGAAIPSFSHGALISIDSKGTLLTQLQTQLSGSETFWTQGAVQKDGKFVVVGGLKQNGEFEVVAARFLPEGTLDPEYNGKGWVGTRLDQESLGFAMAMQEDDKIVVAVEGASQPTLLRYLG